MQVCCLRCASLRLSFCRSPRVDLVFFTPPAFFTPTLSRPALTLASPAKLSSSLCHLTSFFLIVQTRRRAAAKAATPAPEAAEPTEVTEVTETTEATTEPVVDTTTEEAPATTADTETADATDAAPAADIGPVKTATTTATAVTTPAPAPATTASTASRVGDPFVEFPAAAPATLSAGARDALTEAIAQGWLRSNGLQKSLYTRLDSLPDEAADTLVNKFVTKLEERVAAKDVVRGKASEWKGGYKRENTKDNG